MVGPAVGTGPLALAAAIGFKYGCNATPVTDIRHAGARKSVAGPPAEISTPLHAILNHLKPSKKL